MKILVTGAAGFIGSHLAQKLCSLGHDVVGIDCFTDYYAKALKELNAAEVEESGARLHRLDLSSDDLSDAMNGVEVVYHFAAQPGISATTPFEHYLRNNFIATQRLADAARATPGFKYFAYISTSSVYGRFATDPEDSEPKPTSYYGVTKLAGEQFVLAYHRDKGFPACSLRLFSVYGPRERPEKLYPLLIHSILSDKEFPLYEGSLEHSRSFTYVDDITLGLAAVLDNFDACNGEILNIGSDIEITTGQGIEIIEKALGKKAAFRKLPKRPGDQLRTHANIEKARRLIGYAPVTEPTEGLRKEVEWYVNSVFGKVNPYA